MEQIMTNNSDVNFEVGDSVYVKPYSVPGHERPAGSGVIVSIDHSSMIPRAAVKDNNGSTSIQWLHHLVKQ